MYSVLVIKLDGYDSTLDPLDSSPDPVPERQWLLNNGKILKLGIAVQKPVVHLLMNFSVIYFVKHILWMYMSQERFVTTRRFA